MFQFPFNDKAASSLWKSWRKTWTRFEVATGIDEAAEKKRMCTLLSVIGEDAVKMFEMFQYYSMGKGKAPKGYQTC